MGSTYFYHRINTGEAPTHITLPNPPIEFGKRKLLTALVPTYVLLDGTDTKLPQQVEPDFIYIAVAIQSSNNDWLEQTLKNVKKLHLRDEATGITVLHIAAKSSHEPTLNILLKNPDVLQVLDEVDIRGTSPLIVAAWYGNFAALKYFLALGCQTTIYIYDTKKNALHCAADLKDTQICSQLLKYNSKRNFVDALDDDGYSPLMIAVRGGSPCVTILLMSGANYRLSCSLTGRNIVHLAIVFFQNDTLLRLLKALNNYNFISEVDLNGDTPFLLAIKLRNYAAIKMLIINIPIQQLLNNSESCIHYLIKHDDSYLLNVILAAANNVDFLKWTDNKGRTPLMYAVEIQRTDFANEFLRREKELRFRNPITGETVLHVAAYVNNVEIIRELLDMKRVADIIDISDYSGKTAYEIVLSRANQECYYAFKEAGYTIPEFINSNEESSLFIAAKKGNYNIMLNLLLSEKFQSFHQEFVEFNKIELTRAALQGRVYSSDVFIISGEILDIHAWNKCPDQSHLFRHNVKNENIFHACVKGENLMGLAFIYKYCVHFNKYWQEIDEPDRQGTTPLLLATMLGQAQLFKFLVQQGANMAKPNLEGKFPLLSLTKNIGGHKQLLLDMIDECVVKDDTEKKAGPRIISLSSQMFCPPRTKQLLVIHKIFQVLDEERYSDILLHPVLQYLIESKWEAVVRVTKIRRRYVFFLVIFTFLYISIDLSPFPYSSKLLSFIYLPTLILSSISCYFYMPFIYIKQSSWRRTLFTINTLISPLCMIIYLCMESQGKDGTEIGATAILTGGLSVFVYSIDTALGYQVSIFYKVFQSILTHLPLCFILLISFSQCFFVLFHDLFNFSSPVHSFLYTVMVLMNGDSYSFPYFQENDYSKESSRYEKIHIVFQAVMMILFKILITLSLLNMLIGLSIRSASDLEKRGLINRYRMKVESLCEWESIVELKCFHFLSKYHIQYFIGLLMSSDTEKKLEIPVILYPFERPVKLFDMNLLENIAIKQENIKSIDLKFLDGMIGYQEKLLS